MSLMNYLAFLTSMIDNTSTNSSNYILVLIFTKVNTQNAIFILDLLRDIGYFLYKFIKCFTSVVKFLCNFYLTIWLCFPTEYLPICSTWIDEVIIINNTMNFAAMCVYFRTWVISKPVIESALATSRYIDPLRCNTRKKCSIPLLFFEIIMSSTNQTLRSTPKFDIIHATRHELWIIHPRYSIYFPSRCWTWMNYCPRFPIIYCKSIFLIITYWEQQLAVRRKRQQNNSNSMEAIKLI